MLKQSTLFLSVAVLLGFLEEIAGATCDDCNAGEESVLLQRAVDSHDEKALEAESWKWPKPGYSKHKDKDSCVEDVEAIQKEWKEAILDISAAYRDDPESSDYVQLAEDAINLLYGYDVDVVLFKPTLAVEEPFRPTFIGALSYFVGYNATQNRGGVPEDTGFAIASGDTWSKVLFFNDLVSCEGDLMIAQGYYYFKNFQSGIETGVEYSFVYKKFDGKWKILVHHSSLPAPVPGAPSGASLVQEAAGEESGPGLSSIFTFYPKAA